MGDRMAVLNQGRIIQVGNPHEVYNNPRNTFVASFVGSPAINLLSGAITANRAVVTPRSFELPLDGASAGEGPMTFGIRPEDVQVEPGAPVEAKIHDIENHGIEKIVTLRAGDNLIRAAIPASVEVRVEESVRFGWDPAKVMLFDAQTGVNLRHKAA